jgi:hypothetical protein
MREEIPKAFREPDTQKKPVSITTNDHNSMVATRLETRKKLTNGALRLALGWGVLGGSCPTRPARGSAPTLRCGNARSRGNCAVVSSNGEVNCR